MAGESTEPLAGALIAERESPLTIALLDQADAHFARFDRLGAGDAPAAQLLEGLVDRWLLPAHLDGGIELIDWQMLGELAHDWASRPGYSDGQFHLDAPYIVPIDPDRAAPPNARGARRSMRRTTRRPPAGAMRPVAPSAGPRRLASIDARPPATPAGPREMRLDPLDAPLIEARLGEPPIDDLAAAPAGTERAPGPLAAPAPTLGATSRRPASSAPSVARERWRATPGGQLTVYPRAMGRAGAIDAGLLRFPEARARIGGDRPALIAGEPGLDLVPDGGGLAPASRGAERMLARLFDQWVPTPGPVSAWLIPVSDFADRLEARRETPSLVDSATSFGAPDGPPPDALPGLPRASQLAERAPRGALVAPASPPAPARSTPDRALGAGRPRRDGRVPLPAVAPRRAPAGATPLPRAEAARVAAARLDAAPANAARADAVRPAARPDVVGPQRRSAATPSGGPSDPGALPPAARAALAMAGDSDRPADIRRLSAMPGRAGPVLGAGPAYGTAPGGGPIGRAIEPRSGARASGARMWVLDALKPRATSPMGGRRSGPGSTAAAARLLAERLATSMGEPALLAETFEPAPGPAPMRLPGDTATAALVAGLVQPTLERALTPADGGGIGSASTPRPSGPIGAADARADATRALARPTAPAEPAASAGPAAIEAPRPTPPSGSDVHRVDGPQETASEGQAPPRVAPTRVDALAWASEIVGRIAVSGPEAGGLAGAVERLAERITAGRPRLVERLHAFEAAGEPAARSEAWRAVVREAGLDPALATLVIPPAPADTARGSAATPGSLAAPAVSDSTRPGEGPASAEPAAPSRPVAAAGPAPAAGAHRARGARSMAAAVEPRVSAAAARPAIGRPRWSIGRADRRLPGVDVERRAIGLAAQGGSTFEHRMGLTAATRPAAPPEVRRWVIDPGGRRWLVPIADGPAGPAADARRLAAGPPTAALGPDALADATPTAALAERIFSALMPEEGLAVAGVIERLAGARSWVVEGFDGLPSGEHALVRTLAPNRPEAPEAGPGAATRSPRAGGRPVDIGRDRPAPGGLLAASLGARLAALSRPGALGSAAAGLAGRLADRPRMATQTDRRAVVAPPGAAGRGRSDAAGGPGWSSARSGVRRRPPSSMDPVALMLTGATAAEARMPTHLRPGSVAGRRPGSAGGRPHVELGDVSAAVVVSPGGADGDAAFASSAGASPGARTAEAALRAFDRARVDHGTRAAAVGRPAASAADVGQLLSAIGNAAPGGRLFGDRGPLAVTPPTPAQRVYIETGRAAGQQPLRSTGESGTPKAETDDEARHRLASQTEGDLSPEEIETIATEIISILRREQEFDASRFGEDEWD